MKSLLQDIAMIVAMAAMIGLTTVLAVDSYELETTTNCKDCLLLQYIKPGDFK